MKKNVFKFRRLKWGDPEEKFKMLPGDTASSDHRERGRVSAHTIWNDKTLVGVAIVLVVLVAALSA